MLFHPQDTDCRFDEEAVPGNAGTFVGSGVFSLWLLPVTATSHYSYFYSSYSYSLSQTSPVAATFFILQFMKDMRGSINYFRFHCDI